MNDISISWTPAILSGAGGILLSIIFSYVPGAADWLKAKKKETQQLVMLGLLVLISGAAFGLSCVPSFPLPVATCNIQGGWSLVIALATAVVTNQSTYRISPAAPRFRQGSKPFDRSR